MERNQPKGEKCAGVNKAGTEKLVKSLDIRYSTKGEDIELKNRVCSDVFWSFFCPVFLPKPLFLPFGMVMYSLSIVCWKYGIECAFLFYRGL